MAKAWPVYEGKRPTAGEPWADLPLADAAKLLQVKPNHFVPDLLVTPRFGDLDRDLMWAGYKHVLLEVEPKDILRPEWRSGFYKSPVKPREAFRRLLEYLLVGVLGRDNVVRIEPARAVDSLGQETIRVLVVIAPNAVPRIANESVLTASAALEERLRQLFGDRASTILEYATEAELAHDAGT